MKSKIAFRLKKVILGYLVLSMVSNPIAYAFGLEEGIIID